MSDNQDKSNGHDKTAFEADQRIHEAMDAEYDFPSYYPVVLIARRGSGFQADLKATLAAEQGDDPFRVRERSSRRGNYVSYRVELYVGSAQTALERKAVLAELPGVLMML